MVSVGSIISFVLVGVMELNKLRDKAYKIACEHGFHDEESSNEHCLMLVITELSEAVEADRKGLYARVPKDKENTLFDPKTFHGDNVYFVDNFKKNVKDKVEDELADTCIRLLDLAGLRNLNLNRFALVNVVSSKKTFTENVYAIIKDIMNYAITQIFALSRILDIDLLWFIEHKMIYNEKREYKHGKKY